MSRHVLDEGPSWWVLFALACLVLVAVTELGFRGGRRVRAEASSVVAGQSSTVLAALLGLLGLLLAFSFSIVESRFAARKQLVLDEANAIGTAYLRAKMLPAPHDGRARQLLRDYVDMRSPTSAADLEASLRGAEVIHRGLWTEAVAVAEIDPQSEVLALFAEALNELIELHEARLTVALHQRLPMPIFLTLVVVSLFAMCVLGYNAGLARARSPIPTAALVAVVSTVLVLIVELDRPGGDLFRLSQAALLDARDAMLRDERDADTSSSAK